MSGLKKVSEKLHRLKQCLRWWNKHTFGHIFVNVKKRENQVSLAKNVVLNDPSSVNVEALTQAKKLFSEALDIEELFWKQKASLSWRVEGERNNKVFHDSVNKKKARLTDRKSVV